MKPARRRRLALLAASLCAALLVLGLAPGCTRPPRSVIRLMLWGAPDEIRTVQGYLKAFRQLHPEIDVRVEHAPDMGYRQRLQTLLRGDNLADVMYVDQADLAWMAEGGGLLDLTPLAERDAAELNLGDFYQRPLDHYRLHGKLWGILKDFATLCVYYNRDLFDKWDVPYPRAGWTWEDFLATAQAVSREGDWGFLLETWPGELFPWIWQAGGEVARSDPPEWLMGKEPWLDGSAEGLQFLSDLIWVHKVAPGPSVTRDQQSTALFLQGKVAMCTYGRWACMQFKHIKDFDWDVVEMPRHKESATTMFTVCYGIAKHTREPEQAWTLLKFLVSPQAQEMVANSAQAIPARRSVAEGPAFLHPAALEGRDVAAAPHFSQVAIGRFPPRFATYTQAEQSWKDAIEPLWNRPPAERAEGARTAREILAAIQPRQEELVAGR